MPKIRAARRDLGKQIRDGLVEGFSA
jgi:hypothetical protein